MVQYRVPRQVGRACTLEWLYTTGKSVFTSYPVLASSTYQNKVPVTKLYADKTTKEASTIQYKGAWYSNHHVDNPSSMDLLYDCCKV